MVKNKGISQAEADTRRALSENNAGRTGGGAVENYRWDGGSSKPALSGRVEGVFREIKDPFILRVLFGGKRNG